VTFLYSYREFAELQKKSSMSSDEVLEKKNSEILRRYITKYGKERQEPMKSNTPVIDSDIKIYQREKRR